MLRHQSQKCALLAARFLFTSYKTTWLIAINSHCRVALLATDVFSNHMWLNAYHPNLKWTLLPCYCYAMKANFRTIHTQVSQPASAGNVVDMSELQAQNCMTPQQICMTTTVNPVLVQCECHIGK